MHVVIFSGGIVQKSPLILDVIKKADRVIAADQGAKSALLLDVVPEVVIGDFDSLSKTVQRQLEQKGVELIPYPNEKDETDTELALGYAIKNGATKITILGGTEGDRFDHVIANLFLSTVSTVPINFINGNQISQVLQGPASCLVTSKKGDLISLIPLSTDAEGVTTENLKWKLKNEKLLFGRPRGVSNVFTRENAKISLKKGFLLVVNTVL